MSTTNKNIWQPGTIIRGDGFNDLSLILKLIEYKSKHSVSYQTFQLDTLKIQIVYCYDASISSFEAIA